MNGLLKVSARPQGTRYHFLFIKHIVLDPGFPEIRFSDAKLGLERSPLGATMVIRPR
jgi:hypothetical protein